MIESSWAKCNILFGSLAFSLEKEKEIMLAKINSDAVLPKLFVS